LEQEDIEPPNVIINRIRNHMIKNGDMLDVDEIIQVLSIDLLGIVADEDDVIKASNHGEPVAFQPKTRASMAYRNIARRILGESVPLLSLEEKVTFMDKVKKW